MKAIVFVDAQNDFLRGGCLPFGYPTEDNFQKVVDFAAACVKNGDKIYATRDTHQESYFDTLEGKKLPVKHCVEGTDGWNIADPLMAVLLGNCTYVNKPTFGSFDLVEVIAEDFEHENLDEIVICGYDTAICVISNALLLRAKFPNTKITIMKDLCGCINEATHNAALTVAQCCQIDVE